MSPAPPCRQPDDIRFRMAVPDDVPTIHALLAGYAADQLLLPRSPEDLHARIANFAVAETATGVFAGCVALRDYGNRLFEVRSLAVHPDFLQRGIGSALVEFQTERLRRAGGGRVFALTSHPHLFLRLGFAPVDKSLFPEKIWSDCQMCPKQNCCDEDAVLLEVVQ
jgi:amino-acid N-acetyltransferase